MTIIVAIINMLSDLASLSSEATTAARIPLLDRPIEPNRAQLTPMIHTLAIARRVSFRPSITRDQMKRRLASFAVLYNRFSTYRHR